MSFSRPGGPNGKRRHGARALENCVPGRRGAPRRTACSPQFGPLPPAGQTLRPAGRPPPPRSPNGTGGAGSSETLIEIDQNDLFGGAREGRIEPTHHVVRHRLVAEQAPVDENGLPLAALRLVARYGIRELHLKRVIVRILMDFLEAFQLAPDLRVIFFHLVEQTCGFFARERRSLRGERVQQDFAGDLRIVVVVEREHGVRETESVELLEPADLLQARDVAVGDEVHRAILRMLRKVVVVLDHHQPVAALDLLLGPEHVAADSLVVTVGPLVRTGNDDRLVAAVAVVAILQFFEELAALDPFEIGKIQLEAGNLEKPVFEHAPHQRSIEENARLGLLTHHLVERPADRLAVATERRGIERRAAIGTHGRQLGAVARQHQTAAAAAADIPHQIRQQRSAAEERPVGRRVGEHRSLVDDEDGPLLRIEVERELRFVGGIGPLAVDAFVDRQRLPARIARQHLGGPARRREQHAPYPRRFERRDQSGDQRGLARAGVTVEHENLGKIAVYDKFG